MDLTQKFKKALELPGKFLANGGHAQQDIPSQHRLLNAGGMFAAWWAMNQVRQIMFGVKMKSEGEYVEVKLEDVPAPLRFLHKTIDWDPHSETPENQWKKLAYQLIPGVGAGVGATIGSMYAFERNGRAQNFKKLKGLEKLNLLDADYAAQYAQSTPLRLLAAFFGTFSAASGLTFLYGFFLNPAFATANGAKVFAGSLKAGNAAPHKAVTTELGMVGSYIEEAIKTGKVNEEWAEQFATRVLKPLFGHELNTPELQQKAVHTIQHMVEDSYRRFNAGGKPAKEIAEAVTKDLTSKLSGANFDKTLKQAFHLDPADAKLGNSNPILRQFHNFLSSFGLGKTFGLSGATKASGLAVPLGAAAAVGVGTALIPSTASAATRTNDTTNDANEHNAPDATGKTPAEYVKAAVELHNKQYPSSGQPPAWLKWMGDGQLAVLPINRMDCAIGLTAGQIIFGNLAKIATGYSIDGKAVEKVPTYLEWMKGIVKDYNPKGLRPRDRWIRYAQWGVFSLGGLLGVKLGTDFAYRNVKEKNKDPHYLEDYLPRVSMHEGGTWSWLAAFSANFGSASGLWTTPIPVTNYGIGLAGRATSMQDRNFMLPGLNGWISGASTTSFMRLREGMNYLCHYAANNPSHDPAQIEYLAYTTLAPIFKDQLTVEHIQQFTNAVHQVRDKYWQEGGIPKEKRAEALKTMKEVFTGPGQEVLLINMGLNPGTIEFDKLNGLTGKIGNIGQSDAIKKEQNNYDNALAGRLTTYVKQGLITEGRAEWVKAGMEARKQGHKPPAPALEEAKAPETPLNASAEKPKPEVKFTDRVPRKDPAKGLIDKADNPGDWRDEVRIPREDPPLALGA